MPTVVGVDLSGVSGRGSRTAAAAIHVDRRLRLDVPFLVQPGPFGDAELIDWVAARSPAIVAIDAPLTLPHSIACGVLDCDRCRPGQADYLTRDVDRAAKGMSTSRIAAIAFRGMYLAARLRRLDIDVVETYPGVWYRDHGLAGSDGAARAAALEPRVGAFTWTVLDEVDAVCAALAAADWLMGTAGTVDGHDGQIVLPALTPGGPRN